MKRGSVMEGQQNRGGGGGSWGFREGCASRTCQQRKGEIEWLEGLQECHVEGGSGRWDEEKRGVFCHELPDERPEGGR